MPHFPRAFGIEFEFSRIGDPRFLAVVLKSALNPNSDVVHSHEYRHTEVNNRYWEVKRDGSCGWEICTPRFTSTEELEECCRAVKQLGDCGAMTSVRTGIHIHFEMRDLSSEWAKSLIHCWGSLEGLIFQSLPRRRRVNKYCRPISLPDHHQLRGGLVYPLRPQEIESLLTCDNRDRSRRVAMNMRNYYRDGSKRIEFRFIEGSTDPILVDGWVRFLQLFLQKFMEKVEYQGSKMADIQAKPVLWWSFPEFIKWMDPKTKDLEIIRWFATQVRRRSNDPGLLESVTQFLKNNPKE